jgi:protein-L-isoaspartate(D-aspartate) O-methyltransferase
LAEAEAMQEQARHNMVDGQLRPNHVNNHALLGRLSSVAREDFVPVSYRQTAYADTVTPLSATRSLPAPMTLARLLQALELKENDNVLIVAGNSGYSAALVAPLVASVTLIEDDQALLSQAGKHLSGFANVSVHNAAPTAGYPQTAPYSVILLDAAAAHLPQTLTSQLAEGGRLGAVTLGGNGLWVASIVTKHGGTLFTEELFEAKPALHPALMAEQGFVF